MNDSAIYAGEPEGIGVLIPSVPDLFWSAVVIVIIGFFFFKYLMPKMTELLDERAAKIEGGLERGRRPKKRPLPLNRRRKLNCGCSP